jgi:hypothetical protein
VDNELELITCSTLSLDVLLKLNEEENPFGPSGYDMPVGDGGKGQEG